MKYKIYIDLDGVLVDFDRGIKNLMGVWPNETQDRYMWPAVQKTPNFFAILPWMNDGRDLWAHVLPYDPTILTARPKSMRSAEDAKIRWCHKHLGPEIPVIVTLTAEKWFQSGTGHILVDDRVKLKERWEDEGGYFIHHTSTKESIKQLIEIGVK